MLGIGKLTPKEFSLRPGSRLVSIPNGTAGTAATIRQMQKLVTKGKRDRLVRNLAGQLISSCPPKDYRCYAAKIFHFCRDDMKYAYDPVGVEYIESPRRAIEAGIADCDSIVITFAALCEQIGLPCKFVTIKTSPTEPDEFTHVYAEVKIPGQGWIAADPTMPDKPFGWAPDPKYPKKEWPASRDAPADFGEDGANMGSLGQHRCSEAHRALMDAVQSYRQSPSRELLVAAHAAFRKFKQCRRSRPPRPPRPKPPLGPDRDRPNVFIRPGNCPPGYETVWCNRRYPPQCKCRKKGGGMGEIIPGTAVTPGVYSEKEWEFRQEPAAITANPEQLELEPFGEGSLDSAPHSMQNEYWTRTQIENLVAEDPEITIRMKQPPVSPQQMGAVEPEAPSGPPKWVLIAGAAALLLWLGGKK